ncbi:type II secretion system protein [Ferrimonas kyonanensis]|uniref:type II secretion system protein n=1 Tax=Ferrimonas kyonanensis TaxID=364763 RepID=UPI0004098986|nr:prepilin-type N-terminal cleavage/methylation domain-containing protein [Ferrimonas kyonanensis]
MTNQRGFTLIELVVVIIVLGILAVTAAPKFIDLQTDARIATLKGAKGAIQGANALVYAKAAVNGVEGDNCTGKTDGGCKAVQDDISILPVFGSIGASKTDLNEVVELDSNEWDLDDTTTSGTVYITPHDFAVDTASGKPKACQLEYVPADGSVAASYTIEDNGC